MEAAISQFRENISRVRNLGSLVENLNAQTTTVLDLSDILRAELVLAVSALDHYVHEIVKFGMLATYKGDRERTQAFLRFEIFLANVLRGIADPANENWLEQEIRNRHGYRSFQNSNNIADAVRLISDVRLWDEVADRLGWNAQDVRERLGLIVNRRNQIAHEADVNPSYPQTRWAIDAPMVDEAVDFMERVAEAIYDVVS